MKNKIEEKVDGHKLFAEFANVPIGERPRWFENLIFNIVQQSCQELIKEIERMKMKNVAHENHAIIHKAKCSGCWMETGFKEALSDIISHIKNDQQNS